MNAASAIDKYLAACNTFEDAVDAYDEPDYRKKVQSETQKLQSCFQELLQFAESNNPALWHAIGIGFNIGRGVKRDRQEAMRWFQRAAEAGHAPAMVNLGSCLTYPKPSLDRTAAVSWLRKAAEKGYAGGMVSLGFAYREGDGVPRDDKEAVQWFIKAVEAGDSHSMIHVGRMYARQLSAPVEAVASFLRAAEAVHSESFLELATIYENKELPVHDPVEAHKWFRVAVEYTEGHSTSALFAIARQYMQGVGAPCDIENAKWWLNRILLVAPPDSPSRKEATRMIKKLDGQFL
jgi:TPR repeat protein